MKKSLIVLIASLAISASAFAQDGDIVLGLSGRIFGPACTNCDALAGIGLSGGYSLTEKIVVGADLGLYTRSEGGAKLNATAFGAQGEYYFKEAFKGFYIGPDLTFIAIKQKFGDLEFTDNDITFGVNLGWAIPAGEHILLVPHAGYGTWFENSDGRITIGFKVGYKL